ncbi:hypothetical protein JOC58_002136 [Paenibacillus hunanensis]|uniref:Uncharacterized protein n=1 Tax=Paenibacillus hunanensis TaxID=539262 RepID=A0ABU1IYC4_9BACL|nr:hypothetical protein [Paenibacillus hunanensis]
MHKSRISLRYLSLYLSSYFIHSNLLRLYPLYILFSLKGIYNPDPGSSSYSDGVATSLIAWHGFFSSFL